MPTLVTPRLICTPITPQDWPFFLALQQDQQVMRYVAEDRPQEAIREAFESRLPGLPAVSTGYVLWCATAPRKPRLG